MSTSMTIDPTRTVNEIINDHPETVAVFSRFGIDSCCGGAHPIGEAARRHGIDRDALLAALHEAAGAAR